MLKFSGVGSELSLVTRLMDIIFDFIFSSQADGVVRRKRETIRAASSAVSPFSLSASAAVTSLSFPPISKSFYVPPANSLVLPTYLWPLSLFSPTASPLPQLVTPNDKFISSSPEALSIGNGSNATSTNLNVFNTSNFGMSLLEQNYKRKSSLDANGLVGKERASTGLSIFEKTHLKKRKLGVDKDSSNFSTKIMWEATVLQTNQYHIADILAACSRKGESSFCSV